MAWPRICSLRRSLKTSLRASSTYSSDDRRFRQFAARLSGLGRMRACPADLMKSCCIRSGASSGLGEMNQLPYRPACGPQSVDGGVSPRSIVARRWSAPKGRQFDPIREQRKRPSRTGRRPTSLRPRSVCRSCRGSKNEKRDCKMGSRRQPGAYAARLLTAAPCGAEEHGDVPSPRPHRRDRDGPGSRRVHGRLHHRVHAIEIGGGIRRQQNTAMFLTRAARRLVGIMRRVRG